MVFNDSCIAKNANTAGQKKVEKIYLNKACNYQHYFDKSTGFMGGGNADGSWRTTFNPKY